MKKILVILSACLLLFFVSGCSQPPPPPPQQAQPDQDLSEEELDSMYGLVYEGGDFGESFNIYFEEVLNHIASSDSPAFDKNLNNTLKNGNLASKKKVEKISVESGIIWSGPDDDGWYTGTETDPDDPELIYYYYFRYFSSLKKLEYKKVYAYPDVGMEYTESGYMIFNKDIRQDISHAYPVDAKMSISIAVPSQGDSNKNNVLELKFVFNNMDLVYLDQVGMYAWVGSIKVYVTYIDYDDENPEVDNKLMVEATSEIGDDNTSIDISGSWDADGDIYTDDGYTDFYLNVPLLVDLLAG
ncbi:MAG TPA: hypothetical protein PL130_01520 [Dictyoglomaceae bacterium]|nr:hypothetical protein [Dictyoglomaceae bacterium]